MRRLDRLEYQVSGGPRSALDVSYLTGVGASGASACARAQRLLACRPWNSPSAVLRGRRGRTQLHPGCDALETPHNRRLASRFVQLERSVGVELPDRSRHHVALTSAGRVFLQRSERHSSRASSMRDRLAKQRRRRPAPTSSRSALSLPPADVTHSSGVAARSSLRSCPDLRLILHSKYAARPVDWIAVRCTLDVAFVRGPLVARGLESARTSA